MGYNKLISKERRVSIMAGIVRNATMEFSSKKELNEFNKRISKNNSSITQLKLQQKVKADGIKITRGKIDE